MLYINYIMKLHSCIHSIIVKLTKNQILYRHNGALRLKLYSRCRASSSFKSQCFCVPINLINSRKNDCGICSLTYATWKHNSWGISWNVLLFHSVSTSDLQQHYWKHWFKGTVHPEINYCQSLFWICKSHSFPCNYSEWRLTSSKKLASSIGLQGSEETSPLLDATLKFYTLIYASILTHAELH